MQEETPSFDPLVELLVDHVEMNDPEAPMLVLREVAGTRTFPIYVGRPEAVAIHAGLTGIRTPRPMTHDALGLTLDSLGASIRRIVLGFLPEKNTFTADVLVGTAEGDERHLDWRASDAIALAVRSEPVPAILAPESLIAIAHPSPIRTDPGQLRFRCSCGGWMAPETELAMPDQLTDIAEVDVRCTTCGQERHIRFLPPQQ